MTQSQSTCRNQSIFPSLPPPVNIIENPQANCPCGTAGSVCHYLKQVPEGQPGCNACCTSCYKYYELPAGCTGGGTTSFTCGTILWNHKPCSLTGGSTCLEATVVPCLNGNPACVDADGDTYSPRTSTCTPEPGRGDCDDNDPSKHPPLTCPSECDRDGDGYISVVCERGDDCDDDCFLCGPDHDREDFGLSTCSDGRDNDCDGLRDCRDPDCNCLPTPTATRTPFVIYGGGGIDCDVGSALTGGTDVEPVDESDLDEFPGCCSYQEQSACVQNGGTWINCRCSTPIIIDVLDNGFNLTNAPDGVMFDIAREGSPSQVSWTSANSDDALLVLDWNGNGLIDHGKELFGSVSPQPFLRPGESKNGYRALAIFDRFENGGNGDGKIANHDAIFTFLQLWQDVNHNGISEPNELHSLSDLGLTIIELNYHESRRLDDHGNWFRFRSKVWDTQDADIGRWSWDVFLQTQP